MSGMVTGARSLTIAHFYPELLNLYGDSGNMLVLKSRLAWRGLGCTIRELGVSERVSLADVDIAFIGGGACLLR